MEPPQPAEVAVGTMHDASAPEVLHGAVVFRTAAIWAMLVAVMAIVTVAVVAFIQGDGGQRIWLPIVRDHFAAVVGTPTAALAALCVVMVLRHASGPIRVKAWGLEFEGAAAPIIFWLLCFLSIVGSVKTLW